MTTKTTEELQSLPPIHPGEVLNEEFLLPMRVSQYRLAKAIGVDSRRIHAIVHGQRSITAETALLLSRFFGNSAEFWMGLQSQYDLETTGTAFPGGWTRWRPTRRSSPVRLAARGSLTPSEAVASMVAARPRNLGGLDCRLKTDASS